MINIVDVNKPDRENPHITFEELLGKVGKKEEDIEKIYHGLDHWCRCGCVEIISIIMIKDLEEL